MMVSEKSKESNKSKSKEESDFKIFRKSFEQEKKVEEKIGLAIEFMRKVLGQSEGISIKDFWDAKKLCSPLFKEPMNPIKRNHFWSEYIELADEARRLKEIMDEQSAFSIEQIELAIEALEKDLEHYDALIENQSPCKFPSISKSLIIKEKEYSSIQRELQLLKVMVSRLDALRKEILATDMRISHKNRILKRLSKLGDLVFPKRKELIKKVSDAFILEVEAFVKKRFPEGKEMFSVPHYVIFNEIKSFQAVAKFLTLNTQSFTKTRKMLSECWDKIKEYEKEHRKELNHLSEEQKKNFEILSEKVSAFVTFCEKEENVQREKILDEARAIQEEMDNLSLNQSHVTKLRNQIQKARSEALDKIKSRATRIREAEIKKEQDLKNKLTRAIENEETFSLEELQEMESMFKKAFKQLSLSHEKKLIFERNFSDLHSFILDKKGEKGGSKEELEALFDEREALFEEVKVQMESYRKEMGGSNLDFEKAMIYRELFDSAKIHLEKEMDALQQLEEKLNAD